VGAVCDCTLFDIADPAGMITRIDHHGGIRNPVAADEFRLADCAHQDIGATDDIGKVARMGVTDRHGGVGVQQHHRHGFAENGAAPDDHRVLASEWNPVSGQQTHDASWRR